MAVMLLSSKEIIFGVVVLILAVITIHVLRSRNAQLDHISGPFLARYTDLWRVYQAWRSPLYKGLQNYQMRLVKNYGDIVRIGPNTVLVNDPDDAHTALGFKERLEKGPGYRALAMSGTNQTALLGIRDEATHRAYRRPIAHAYSVASLKGYEASFDETIQELVNALDHRAESGEPINMSEWLHYWAFDVISKISFGRSLGFLKHGRDFNGMIRAQKAAFRYFSVVSQFPTLDSFLKRNPVLNYFNLVKPSVFLSFGQEMVRARADLIEQDPESIDDKSTIYSDMLGYFFAAKPRYPTIMTNQRISMYCLVNVLAGANNSALAMGRTMHHFANHPSDWNKLQLDVLDADEKSQNLTRITEPVALEVALQSSYTEGVINESLRLMPTLSSNLERTAPSAGLTLSNGIHIPARTNIAINTSAVTRREDAFGEDALNFNPLRWMRHEGEDQQHFAERRGRMDRCMLQFGAGSRGCIGRNVVNLEMYKAWATLATRYTFEPVGNQSHENGLVKVFKR